MQSQPSDIRSIACGAPSSQQVIVADIECLLCARPIGTAKADHWPPSGPVLFRAVGSSTFSSVPTWSLRCAICGGNTVATELTIRRVRIEPPFDWLAERPRRGRPPTSLAQRQLGNPNAA